MMKEIYPVSISAHAYQRFRKRIGDASVSQIDDFILTDEMRNWLAWGVIRVNRYKGLNILAREGIIISILADAPGMVFKNVTIDLEPADG